MLSEIQIRNLGVIAKADVALDPGMIAITGETGAGKSLLIESVRLLRGDRAEAGQIRSGAPEAAVIGRFEHVSFGVEATDVDVDLVGQEASTELSEVLVRRVLPVSGRSRAYVDDDAVTLAKVEQLVGSAVVIHGQNAHQHLLSPVSQREALDTYGQIDSSALDQLKATLRALLAKQQELGGDERARAHERDLLKFQVDELDSAGLKDVNEEASLANEEQRLGSIEELREALSSVLEALDGEGGADSAVGLSISRLDKVTALEPYATQLRLVQGELHEVIRELTAESDKAEEDPKRLDDIRVRQAKLRDLRRKYGEDIAAVMQFHSDAARRLVELDNRSQILEQVDGELVSVNARIAKESANLAKARLAIAPKFAAAITGNVMELAMPHAKVSIEVAGEDGAQVTIMLAANKGQPAQALAKAASGGELSRVMLAIHLCLLELTPAKKKSVPTQTLIFDEVDAGLGGEAGDAIGKALARVAQRYQVLVITHLAQVAAYAQQHLYVEKHDEKGMTVASISSVQGEDRINEVARMLAGKQSSASAKQHAREVLEHAQAKPRSRAQGGRQQVMRIRPRSHESNAEISGSARLGKRTKEMVSRLKVGEVAIINHADLDRLAADDLAHAKPVAVLNAKASMSSRYPNAGPLVLLEAGIPLYDATELSLFDAVKDGDLVEVRDNEIFVNGASLGSAVLQTRAVIERLQIHARANIDQALEEFASNTLEYVKRERGLVLDAVDVPKTTTRLNGRHTLVVVRGFDYREDLLHLRPYIRELRPVIIAVDGGADALLELGFKPQIIVGDFDSISDAALNCGAELVVHAYPDGVAPGAQRLDELKHPYVTFPLAGTSEDAALLLAYEAGAELIVAVGTHASMVEFLDKGRSGMASTFLTRLKVGPLLVDAKGVSRLYGSRIKKTDFAFFLLAAVACFAAIVAVAYPLQVFLHAGWLILRRGL